MLKICIGGLTASGKTTLGEVLSKELNILNVNKYSTATYKKVMADTSLTQSEKITETAVPKYADIFDKEIIELANSANCVVSTWLCAWQVKNPTIRVWLNADFKTRVQRCVERYHMNPKDAQKYLKEKDEKTINSFKKVQNINIMDRSGFDIELNTPKLSISECASVISMLALLKEKNNKL